MRPIRLHEPLEPAQFFATVPTNDLPMIDSRCRLLHIANFAQLQRTRAKLFVNFYPQLFFTDKAIDAEVRQILRAAAEVNITPDRIVCEIAQKENDSTNALLRFVSQLRDQGLKIALDDYGNGESDISRLKILRPDFVKFEAEWVKAFMQSTAGAALLRLMVNQFHSEGSLVVFEGLEEMWQVDLCLDLGVTLMQGYALARPEMAPTTFDERFPEHDLAAGDASPRWRNHPVAAKAVMTGSSRHAAFGKRAR